MAVFQYCVLVAISMKKDLTIFIRMGSLGAVCVTSLTGFVVVYGVMAIRNTKFDFNWGPTVNNN